ncbi:MAG TPA: hypothetical protein PLK06_03640, partial [bacterium]|nr:hypothetical protein [bacterium]
HCRARPGSSAPRHALTRHAQWCCHRKAHASMRLPLSSLPPALFHPPKLLPGDAGNVGIDPLVGGSAQGFELGGGHESVAEFFCFKFADK